VLPQLGRTSAGSPLFRRDWLWAAALRGGLLTPVPLVGHEGFVDGKVLDVGLEDVHDIRLTGNHDQLGVERHGLGLVQCEQGFPIFPDVPVNARLASAACTFFLLLM